MGFAASVERWRDLVEAHEADDGDPFPTELALKWFELESGGNPCSTGRVAYGHVYEAGLAQTYFETPDSVVFGVTSAQLRAACGCIGTTQSGGSCTDGGKAMHVDVALRDQRNHRARARAKLQLVGVDWPEGERDFWCFVKLHHALPGLYSYLAPCKRALGREPTWDEYKAWVGARSATELAAIDSGTARYASEFGRIWRNCEAFAGEGSPGVVELALLLALGAAAWALSRVFHVF